MAKKRRVKVENIAKSTKISKAEILAAIAFIMVTPLTIAILVSAVQKHNKNVASELEERYASYATMDPNVLYSTRLVQYRDEYAFIQDVVTPETQLGAGNFITQIGYTGLYTQGPTGTNQQLVEGDDIHQIIYDAAMNSSTGVVVYIDYTGMLQRYIKVDQGVVLVSCFSVVDNLATGTAKNEYYYDIQEDGVRFIIIDGKRVDLQLQDTMEVVDELRGKGLVN